MSMPINWGVDNTIDSRDIIERLEELQGEYDTLTEEYDEAKAALAACLADEEDYPPGTEDELAGVEAKTLAALGEWLGEYGGELGLLRQIAAEGEDYGDWEHGETLILQDYFVQHIEELISDCYEMPKEMQSGAWPWRHITIDYEAAADEASSDYAEIEVGGYTYLMRA